MPLGAANPFRAPAAGIGRPAVGIDGLRAIGDRFAQHTGFLSSQAYQGRLYANAEYIALCGTWDLSAQGKAAVFGVVGMLAYHLLRRPSPPLAGAALPLGLAEQLEIDRISPLVALVLRKSDGIRIIASALSGVRLIGQGMRFSIGNGLLGGRRMTADLAALGYDVA